MRMRTDDNSFDVFYLSSLPSCSEPLQAIESPGVHAGRIIIRPQPPIPDFYRVTGWESPNPWHPPNPAREYHVVLFFEIHGTPRTTRPALVLHLSEDSVTSSDSLWAPEADHHTLPRDFGTSIGLGGALYIDDVQSPRWTHSPSGSFMLITNAGRRDPLGDKLHRFKARFLPTLSHSLRHPDRTTQSDDRQDDQQGVNFDLHVHRSNSLIRSAAFQRLESVAFDIASGRFMHINVRNTRRRPFRGASMNVFQFL